MPVREIVTKEKQSIRVEVVVLNTTDGMECAAVSAHELPLLFDVKYAHLCIKEIVKAEQFFS